jgi:hypothetical protein
MFVDVKQDQDLGLVLKLSKRNVFVKLTWKYGTSYHPKATTWKLLLHSVNRAKPVSQTGDGDLITM